MRVINYSSRTDLFEKVTINLLLRFSKITNCKILHLHTKGVSYNPPSGPVTDWRNYMLYFLV